MAEPGKIREQDIIEKSVYDIGDKYAKGLDPAIEANKEWLQTFADIKKAALTYQQISSQFKETKGLRQFIALKKEEAAVTEQTAIAYKEQDRVEKTLLVTMERKKIATEATAKALAQERLELQILNRNAKEAATLSSSLASEYQKQVVRLNQLKRSYKDVALTEGEASTKAKALRADIIKLDATLKKVDANVGEFQRNVGNYSSALGSASKAVSSMLSAMGAVGGAYLFVRVIGDAFNRIREFDKEMQNMAGILRTDRKELENLEQVIIDVAGASTKTSNEVAKLASGLLTLGNSKEEVEDLLQPVNDLGIAMGVTSEEAGEFTVQMLNAFGKSTDSAGEFADTIASIRTSSTLDFQKMRDSFQYLAPISALLNKDLAYTGSLVGILADNSLKAESAGRLLSTAQIKLANDGLTLQDGLDKINEALAGGADEIETLRIAGNLFGAQAAKVGVILAKNTDLIDENAEAIRNNGGALDDLIEQQLESMDAKLKILDSTWEKFILSIEKGDGVLSKSFSGVVEYLTDAVDALTYLNQTEEERLKTLQSGVEDAIYERRKDYYKEIGEEAVAAAKIDFVNSNEEVKRIEKEIEKLQEKNESIKEGRDFLDEFSNAILTTSTAGLISDSDTSAINSNNDKITELTASLANYQGQLKASKDILNLNTESTEENAKAKEDEIETTNELTEAEKRLIEQRNKQLKEDAFNLDKARLQDVIDENNAIIDNEEATLTQKQVANIRYFEAKQALLKLETDKEIAEAQGRKDKLTQIDLEYNNEVKALEEERQANSLEFLDKAFEKKKESIEKAFEKKKESIEKEKDLREQALNDQLLLQDQIFQNSLQTPEDVEIYEKAIAHIKKQYALEALQVQIDAIDEIPDKEDLSTEQRAELALILKNLKVAYSQEETEQILDDLETQQKAREKAAKAEQALKERIINNAANTLSETLGVNANEVSFLIDSLYEGIEGGTVGLLDTVAAAASVTRDIVSGVFKANIDDIDRQLEASSEYYNSQYELAEGNAIKQDLIRQEQTQAEAKLLTKKRQEQEKQAKYDKALAVFEIGINTASAVVEALPIIPLSILAGVLGAIQLAAVIAKPIPKFKDGHLSGTHEGWAITNDGGRDEVWERNGKAQVIKGRNVPIEMQKGDKIYKSEEDYKKLTSASILESVEIDNNKLNSYKALNVVNDNIDLLREIKGMRQDIKHQKPVRMNQTKIDINHAVWAAKNIKW